MSKERYLSILYRALFVLTLSRLLFNFIYGFRWPSEYVCSQNTFTYRYGFLPRAFVGTIMQLIFGENMYSYKANYLIAIGTGLLLLFWLIWRAYFSGCKDRNIGVVILIFWYSMSIYSAYSAHEMGYFEQYGYILIIIYIELLRRCTMKQIWILGAILSFLAVLISETNLFVISPVFFFIGLTFSAEHNDISIKNILKHIVWYIPSGILGLLCNKFQASSLTIATLLSDLHKYNPGYNYAAGLGKLMFQNRIYFEAQQRNDGSTYLPFTFVEVPWQILLYVIVMVFWVSIILWRQKKRQMLPLYWTATATMSIVAYSINFIALDLDRFRYCGVMMIFFYSIYICLRSGAIKEDILNEKSVQKQFLYAIIAGTVCVLLVMDFRLSLFEDSVYNENFIILKETLKGMQW